jgi:hypothetical protein
VQLDNLQATVDGSPATGKLDVNLRGSRPTYKLTAKVKGVRWQSGKLDAEGSIETFGTGLQLLANMTGDGVFTGTAVDFGSYGVARTVTGAYNLAWNQAGPRLRLSNLSVRTEEETFTGRAATVEDGRLAASLSSGAREMRLSGTLTKLRVE